MLFLRIYYYAIALDTQIIFLVLILNDKLSCQGVVLLAYGSDVQIIVCSLINVESRVAQSMHQLNCHHTNTLYSIICGI